MADTGVSSPVSVRAPVGHRSALQELGSRFGLRHRLQLADPKSAFGWSNRLQLSVIARHNFKATCTTLGRIDSAGILPVKFTRVLHRVDGELEAYPAIINRFQNHALRFLSP